MRPIAPQIVIKSLVEKKFEKIPEIDFRVLTGQPKLSSLTPRFKSCYARPV